MIKQPKSKIIYSAIFFTSLLIGLQSHAVLNASLLAPNPTPGSTLFGVRINPVNYSKNTSIVMGNKTFDLSKDADLNALIDLSASISDYLKQLKVDPKATTSIALPDYAKPEIQEKFGISDKSVRLGLSEINGLAVIAAKDSMQRADAIVHIQEINSSLNMLTRLPQPDMRFRELTKTLSQTRKVLEISKNGSEATNLVKTINDADSSTLDPVDSTFWKKSEVEISNLDLYLGSNRKEMLSTNDQICNYTEPKTSWGTHAGFSFECNGNEMKYKFSDFHVEPFNERIMWALGYNTDPVDYAAGLKLAYSRKFFTEINMRKIIAPKLILPSFIPDLTIMTITQQENAFDFIKKAVLKDGREISKQDLPAYLLSRKMADWDLVHLNDIDFNEKAEANIAYLVLNEGQLQGKNKSIKSIGPWDWNELGHEDRRELRGMALAAAWLAFYDLRFDNNRLALETKANNDSQIIQMVSDLGAGLGGVDSLLKLSSLNPNAFNWEFTKTITNKKTNEKSVQITGFFSVQEMNPLDKLTLNDAKWMARKIGQITEDQLKAALIASGMESEIAKIYLEKLISRRDKMISDLGLSEEIPLLRTAAQHEKILTMNYNPKKDGALSVTLSNGKLVSAPVGNNYIADGILALPYEKSYAGGKKK